MAFVLAQLLSLALLLLAATCRASASHIVYVSPECPRSNESAAAANTDGQLPPCEDLSSALDGLESNTTLVLLPGTHRLDRSRTVSDKTNLIFRGSGGKSVTASQRSEGISGCNVLGPPDGFPLPPAPPSFTYYESPVVVSCVPFSSALELINVTNLSVLNITFSNCGTGVSRVEELGRYVSAALFLYNVRNAVLTGVTVKGSYGFGLYGFNVLGGSITASTFVDNNNYCSISGGSVLLNFTDLIHNHTSLENTNLTIKSSTFAFSFSGSADYLSANGAGVHIDFVQTVYRMTVSFTDVRSYANLAVIGANFFFRAFPNVEHSKISMDHSHSSNAIALLAGAGLMYISLSNHPNHLTILNSRFLKNDAYYGGGVYLGVFLDHTPSEENNIVIEGCTINENIGTKGSGLHASFSGLHRVVVPNNGSLYNANMLQVRNTTFESNTLRKGDIPHDISALEFVNVAQALLKDCRFSHNNSSAIHMLKSNAFIGGNLTFFNNTGIKGGGVLVENSFLFLLNPSYINFTQNTATARGGALFVENPLSSILYDCFLQILDPKKSAFPDITVYFRDNYASEAGSALYGGNLLHSRLQYECSQVTVSAFQYGEFESSLIKIGDSSSPVNTSLFSSDPFRVCGCAPNSIECLEASVLPKEAFSGQTVTVFGLAVGQANGSAPGVVIAELYGREDATFLEQLEVSQPTNKTCSKLTYTIGFPTAIENNTSVRVALSTDKVMLLPIYDLIVEINFSPCPTGFEHDERLYGCGCGGAWREHSSVHCDINSMTVTRSGNLWLGINKDNQTIVFRSCPLDYCVYGEQSIPVDDLDQQCGNNRVGTLCGRCRENYSLVLGSSRCMECSNNNISLILAFAVLGVLLVVLLSLCNLTVAKGTINGLIFYANIVQFNHAVFFPSPVKGYTYFLSVFIAWINLDFGIETCFFDGMNALWKNGLQLAFPASIILVIILFGYVASKSSKVSRMVGYFNGTAVIATLLLLSYSKAVVTVIASLAVARVDGTFVWWFDGNVDSSSVGWALLILLMCLLFLTVLLPFTLTLVFMQAFQRLSHRRIVSWMKLSRLQPWYDVFANPFKTEFYFWTGLLLLVRIVLCFATNFSTRLEIGLYSVTVVTASLLSVAWFRGGVYKRWQLNALECFSLLNLCILSATTLLTGSPGVAVELSVTAALICFLVVVMGHGFTSFCHWYQKMPEIKAFIHSLFLSFKAKPDDVMDMEIEDTELSYRIVDPQNVATTFIELRESILDYPL